MADPCSSPKASLDGVDESVPPMLLLIIGLVTLGLLGLGLLWRWLALPSPVGTGEVLAGVVFCVSYAWALGALFVAHRRAGDFLAGYPEIAGSSDLEAFQDLARWSMRLALLQMGVMGIGFLTGLALMAFMGLQGLVLVLVANGAVAVVAKINQKREQTVRSLPVRDPQLREQYLTVAQTWVKKALPDF